MAVSGEQCPDAEENLGVRQDTSLNDLLRFSYLVLEPLFDDQELDSRATTGTIYWEGAVRARVAGGEAGRGYLELTGYEAPLKL